MFRVAFFGDIVGSPGRSAFMHASRVVRREYNVELVIANAENAKNGSGLHPEGYRELRAVGGADALTLGDHVFKDTRIVSTLEDPLEPIARPANLSPLAPGKRVTVIPGNDRRPAIALVTVLGRLYMTIPADDPFQTITREVLEIEDQHPGALVIVEIHAEATAEKQAVMWHCVKTLPSVIAVVGSHTHCPTADFRVLENRVAAVTDLGMCGSRRSVIGREVDDVLKAMTVQYPCTLEVASADSAAQGVVITIDDENRRATAITRVEILPEL